LSEDDRHLVRPNPFRVLDSVMNSRNDARKNRNGRFGNSRIGLSPVFSECGSPEKINTGNIARMALSEIENVVDDASKERYFGPET
jgi:hypothetical protein